VSLRPALLIGGKSSRMGKNKSELERDGKTLGIYLANLLEEVTGIQPVLLGTGQLGAGTERYQILPDPEPDRGPLAGLIAFARAFPKDDLLLCPTDLYAMDEKALRWIKEQAEASSKLAVWPKQPQRKHGEPLAAIYRSTSFPYLESAWLAGKGSPCQAIEREIRHEPDIPEALRLAFVNINTPEELAAVKRGLEGDLDDSDRALLFPSSRKRAHHH